MDQQQLASGGFFGSPTFAPIGQEFVPTFNRLNRVVLRLADLTGIVEDFSFTVGIREDTITGTLLSTSDVETRPDGFDFENVNFDFATDVALTLGNRYVLEFNLLTGQNAALASVGVNSYPQGSIILNGTPSANNDLYFQTGIVVSTVPEPGSIALLVGMTTTGGVFAVRKRRARK